MNGSRRISLRIEHRAISVSVTQTTGNPEESDFSQNANDDAPAPNCPDCGSPWLSDFATALRDAPISLELLQSAILNRRLHLQPLAEGQFRVCERSFQQVFEAP